MSREIKFRVWSYEDKEYRTDCNLTQVFNSMTGMPATMYGDEGDRFDIEQYTGLKDKNGKEIYEGDILLIPARKDKSNGKLYTVEWHKVHARFNFANRNGEFGEINIGKIKRAEVIGNIHENPELLGGKE